MSTMLSFADVVKSRYLFHRSLLDLGYTVGQACIASVVLFGPEPDDDTDVTTAPVDRPEGWESITPDPDADDFEELAEDFEPAEEDLEDYLLWSARLELPPWPDDHSGYVSDRDIVVLQG